MVETRIYGADRELRRFRVKRSRRGRPGLFEVDMEAVFMHFTGRSLDDDEEAERTENEQRRGDKR